MIKKYWKHLKLIVTILSGMLLFGIYLYASSETPHLMSSNEFITLPTIGISMPYWLIISIGYILLPLICSIKVYSALEFIEQKMQS